jgi:hypothetical protein
VAVRICVAAAVLELEDAEAAELAAHLRRHDDFAIERIRRTGPTSLALEPNPDPPGDAAAAAVQLEAALESDEANRRVVNFSDREARAVMYTAYSLVDHTLSRLLKVEDRTRRSPRLRALADALEDALGPFNVPDHERW